MNIPPLHLYVLHNHFDKKTQGNYLLAYLVSLWECTFVYINSCFTFLGKKEKNPPIIADSCKKKLIISINFSAFISSSFFHSFIARGFSFN